MEKLSSPIVASPDSIMQIGMGFWASKILLTAVKFDLFSKLSIAKELSAEEIRQSLNLKCTDRHLFDFLDALTVFGFLQRKGKLETATYANSAHTNIFLDKKKPSYIGGILELANGRLYNSWAKLDEALTSGLSQSGLSNGEEHHFDVVYQTPEKLKEFINAMSGINLGNFQAFAKKFDFSNYRTLTDAGGCGASLSILVAQQHAHMQCINFDLPAVEEVAKSNIADANVSDRVKAVSGDFFNDEIPTADVVVMANTMHDWAEEKKLLLMKKAYEALPAGGAFVAIENIIDDAREKNAFGMMMSLNMLVQTGKGFDYTPTDFNQWAKSTGFKRTAFIPLAGPSTAAVAYK
jgi:precorrin-6B methylase 2